MAGNHNNETGKIAPADEPNRLQASFDTGSAFIRRHLPVMVFRDPAGVFFRCPVAHQEPMINSTHQRGRGHGS
jgi:hypothetical protein